MMETGTGLAMLSAAVLFGAPVTVALIKWRHNGRHPPPNECVSKSTCKANHEASRAVLMGIEQRFGGVDERMDRMDTRLEKIDDKLTTLLHRRP